MAETIAAQEPAALMGRAFEALRARDLDALAACWHDEVVEDFVVLGVVKGKRAVREFFAETLAAFPDFEFEMGRVMGVDETTAVGEWVLRGTFSGGPFQGLEPTGREVHLRGLDVMEFEDGLMRHNTVYNDGLAFARQIGMLPADGTRTDAMVQSGFNALTRLQRRLRSWSRTDRQG